MRIRRLQIDGWRNLRNVDLEIEADASLVCLVGENGTGKSAVLEMLAACSHELGIARGVEMARGNPFADPHWVRVEAQFSSGDVEVPPHVQVQIDATGEAWTGLLIFERRHQLDQGTTTSFRASGISDPALSEQVAVNVVNLLRQRKETQHLYLDADRAYPPMQIQPHQYGEIWQQRWEDPEFTSQWSYRPTKTLYEEWLKYFIGLEQRVGTEHIASIRRAREASQPEPSFVDPFDSFRASVREVLPHLAFVGVEPDGSSRTILFDSVGQSLNFSKLSSGEREIAFLIGQIERFQLRRGLLMIDEPELHLNPDLVRTWLAYLRETVEDGQVWIATHSLEAVEVSGPQSTFVFERDSATRIVDNPRPLAGRPVIAALSAAIGAPAFSLGHLRFVFIEGDRQGRERERFFAVCGEPARNRFLEGGSCGEVLRRLASVRLLAEETEEILHVGGVIDRDFRNDSEALVVAEENGVHVLGCHEVENLFLSPTALMVLRDRAGLSKTVPEVLLTAADYYAGLWVSQAASWRCHEEHSIPRGSMQIFSDQRFGRLDDHWDELVEASVAAFGEGEDDWREQLNLALERYRALRTSEGLWRECLGKQALVLVARELGLSSAESLTRQVLKIWGDDAALPPTELLALRGYVGSLAP